MTFIHSSLFNELHAVHLSRRVDTRIRRWKLFIQHY